LSILSVSALARALLQSTPGEAARKAEAAAGQEMRLFIERALQEVIRLSLEEALGPVRRSRGDVLTPWSCSRCGPCLASQLMRNGTYERSPLTRYGPVRLRIPQLICRRCKRSVAFVLPCLPRFRRLWCDVEHELVRAYLSGHSYRTVASQVAGQLGLMTAWRTVQRAATGPHKPPATPRLSSVGLDEMHVRVHGQPRWYLTARGWTEDGKAYYLGAVLSEDRSQQAWEIAIDSLGLRSLAAGARLIADGDSAIEGAVRQCLPGRELERCAWHVLHNVNEWLRQRLPGAENEGQRRGLLAGAQAVVNAPTPRQRRQSLEALRTAAPWLVASLRPALSRVGYPGEATPRTNNVCERGFREWRRRVRPMDGFGSDQGAANFGTLWMLKENARALGLNWMEVIMP
jgi:transposase-like protein